MKKIIDFIKKNIDLIKKIAINIAILSSSVVFIGLVVTFVKHNFTYLSVFVNKYCQILEYFFNICFFIAGNFGLFIFGLFLYKIAVKQYKKIKDL